MSQSISPPPHIKKQQALFYTRTCTVNRNTIILQTPPKTKTKKKQPQNNKKKPKKQKQEKQKTTKQLIQVIDALLDYHIDKSTGITTPLYFL